MRITLLTLMLLLFFGCTLAPVQPVATYSPNMGFEEAAASMAALVNKCWTHESNPFKHDDIYPTFSHQVDALTITIGRDERDIPYMPFARINVMQAGNSAKIVVEEGDAAYGGAYNVKDSVDRWLNGDQTCRPLKLQKLYQ